MTEEGMGVVLVVSFIFSSVVRSSVPPSASLSGSRIASLIRKTAENAKRLAEVEARLRKFEERQ